MSKKEPEKKQDLKPLTPPDLIRCQAEKHNGYNFMTLGGVPKLERCKEAPTVVATEKKPGKDGRIGSMSLCTECYAALKKTLGPDYATAMPVEIIRGLSWRRVFACHKTYPEIESVRAQAAMAGYEYFEFNHTVFAVKTDGPFGRDRIGTVEELLP